MKDSHTRLRDWEALLEDIDYVWLDRAKDTLTPKLKEILESTLSTELESIRKEIEGLEVKYPELMDYVAMVEKARANGKYDDMYDNGFKAAKSEVNLLLSNRIQK